MTQAKKITTPLDDKSVRQLQAGDSVLLTGYIYTARDAAHKRLIELIEKGQKLPIELKGQIIFYAGPTPTKPGHSCGSVGPTTSYRMDPYTPPLLEKGLKGMIGKGFRSKGVAIFITSFIDFLPGLKYFFFIIFPLHVEQHDNRRLLLREAQLYG